MASHVLAASRWRSSARPSAAVTSDVGAVPAGIATDSHRTGVLQDTLPAKLGLWLSCRYMFKPASALAVAAEVGVSDDTVYRIWRQHGPAPHRVETFKLSNDEKFVQKLQDVVGLYLDPPERALVLSVDEKSQIQALERTRPLLPLGPGIPARQTRDSRHDTTTL